MSAPEPMPSVRRRPIPGMTKPATTSPPFPPPELEPIAIDKVATDHDGSAHPRPLASANDSPVTGREPPQSRQPADTVDGPARWPVTDYAATRLANFRIPIVLLDRYRQLVREAEDRDPRLRRPSVTEVVIGLLSEGPTMPDEVAELIRRKRAAEHGLDG
jgi:hypothetical protein